MDDHDRGGELTERSAERTDAAEFALAAARAGYFEVPRETTLVELAEARGITDRTASRRLRRGIQDVFGEFETDDEP